MMSELEQKLCEFYNKKYGVYTGNGTTAMYLTFMALGMQSKKVVFPNITCTNPVNAAFYAGYDVLFCDVNSNDYTIDTAHLSQLIEDYEVGIVVPTHIYGHICNLDEIRKICNEKNILIMEDAAQTYKLFGADISITSFGHTKLFETEAGGGMVFCDDEELFQKIKAEKGKIKAKPSNYNDLFDEYRARYYKIVKGDNALMKQLQMDSREIFIFDSSENAEILDILDSYDEILEARKVKADLYRNGLVADYIELPQISEESKYLWRFTFLFRGNRDELLKRVREQKIDISSWYPQVSEFYTNESTANASVISNSVVNLWVTEDHSIEQIRQEIEVINNIMKEMDTHE